jgi:hypothetical protein
LSSAGIVTRARPPDEAFEFGAAKGDHAAACVMINGNLMCAKEPPGDGEAPQGVFSG